MREIRLSGSEGGVAFKPPSLPLFPSGRKADVASTRLCFSEATVFYKEVAPTALLKKRCALLQSFRTFEIASCGGGD
jgi:hypothetical protein